MSAFVSPWAPCGVRSRGIRVTVFPGETLLCTSHGLEMRSGFAVKLREQLAATGWPTGVELM